ncbi:MAG: hypothetical protein Q4B43_00200 [Bacteroidota bacterium]|nr:hypothetical protein [Bacteroidota bacterium]
MKKIYILFVVIFAILIVLELNFKPSKKTVEVDNSAVPVVEDKNELLAVNYYDNQQDDFEQQQYHNIEIHNKKEEYELVIPEGYELQAADPITWGLLGKIKYEKKPHQDYPEGVMFPIVNKELKDKKGKKITISGFIIPIDESSYALSKNVFASCFFCGQAGPETIMGIKFKNLKKRLKTDQYVTLEGIFRYNETDVEDWIYHIENAVITKGE